MKGIFLFLLVATTQFYTVNSTEDQELVEKFSNINNFDWKQKNGEFIIRRKQKKNGEER
jgi:hypothetical protein